MLFIRRLLPYLIAALLVILVSAELAACFVLGLGTPPLSITHPTIEYLFAPNQDVNRFGNRILINSVGMRSPDFSATKAPDEFRVLAFGDSVLNGGNLTDHENLATTILAKEFSSTRARPVTVGNVSAGSWGAGNWLAYAQEYGFFESDVVLLLISSHDIADNPTFAPLNPHTHPQVRPMFAAWEGVTRYLPRYLPFLSKAEPAVSQAGGGTADIERGRRDLKAFLKLARDAKARVVLVQFPERSELESAKPALGYYEIKSIAQRLGVETVSAFPVMAAALARGENPYRDNIHVNDLGQRLLAELFLEVVRR
jgi:lysophospholipase L1-like esterase